MRDLLQVGDAILQIIEGDWDRVEELSTLFALRAELIAALDPLEDAAELLRQDQRLQNSCTSQLHRLRNRRRFHSLYQSAGPARYIDQRG